MPALKYIYGIVYLVTALCTAPSHENTTPAVNSVEEDIELLHREMPLLEERIMSKIELAKTSLRSELQGTIQLLVTQAVAEIIKGTPPNPTVQVKAADATLNLNSPSHPAAGHPTKQPNSTHPDQHEKMEEEPSLKPEKTPSGRKNCTCPSSREEEAEEVLKPENAPPGRKNMTCPSYREEEAEGVLKELRECRMRACHVEEKLRLLLSEMNQTCSEHHSYNRSTTEANATSVFTSSTPSAVPPGLVTTAGGTLPKVNTSIFIAKTPSSGKQFGQLRIQDNSYELYPYIGWQIVTAVAYVKKLNRLLIGSYNPNSIITSKLYTFKVRTLKEDVECYGMAVDDERDAIFMTTQNPIASISRMTTRGRRFKVIIDLSTYDRHPLRIAVHPRDKRIFANTNDKIFTVGYDGRDFVTLVRGRSMHSLTLDSTGNILFFNDDTRLLKMSISRHLTSEVTTFGSSPWDLIYYKNTLYYSVAQYRDSGTIGLVYLRGYGQTLELHNVTYNNYGYGLNICLIP